MEILHLGPRCVDCYFPEDITSAVLFRGVVSINYRMLMKIVESHFRKNYRFVFWSPSEEPCVSYLCPFLHDHTYDEHNKRIHS
jgi:hypothetical protein